MVGRSITPGGTKLCRIVGAERLHHVGRALQDARDARFADEHVVRFLGQHELRRAREGIEARLGQRAQLELAVAVGEVREHEEREPIRRLLVECAQDARVVGVAGAPFEEGIGFLAAVAAEVAMQQVHHRPEVAAFLDVDLEEVAQVVERRAGEAEVPLLLDGRGLGVALRDDDAAKVRAVLARHVLPRGLAYVLAEVDLAIGDRGCEEDAPAIVGHLHVVEVRPSRRVDAHRGAQVDVERLRAFGPHLVPPRDVAGLPVLEGAVERAVAGEVDVVGDPAGGVDGVSHVRVGRL